MDRGHLIDDGTGGLTRRIIGAAKSVKLDCGFRMDMLVERTVVVELEVVRKLDPVHTAQLLTYLRCASLRVGLLFNFNVKALAVGGFKRVLNGF